LKTLKQKLNHSIRDLAYELKLIETDLLYKISDKQKTYQLPIALFPDLSKDIINEIKFKITFRDQIVTIARRYEENFKDQFFNNTLSRNKNGKTKTILDLISVQGI
jgi:hypothetical protein